MQRKAFLIHFLTWLLAGGAEFGAPALKGYLFNLNGSIRDESQGFSRVEFLGQRAISCFPEFVVNAAGSPGQDGNDGEHGAPGRRGVNGAHGKVTS
jgi:hypothetical protein